jgi:hypothetical protein
MYHHKLIALYFFVCERYEKDYSHYCARQSKNQQVPDFTDEELLTVYLFVVSEEERFKIKSIHDFAKRYLYSWFPKLPSYQAFNNRLNQLVPVFEQMLQDLITMHMPADCSTTDSLLDSMPIITCSGKRSGKVARSITDKGYCSTKSMYYYGLKLHLLGWRRDGCLPWPESIVFTPASENDLNLFKHSWCTISNRNFFGDKIYHDAPFFDNMKEQQQAIMFTPVKAVKGQTQSTKQFAQAYNDLFSKAVSTVRQPIEALFSWLIQKTDIQRASRVRSDKGLLIHVLGKLTAAFIFTIFNP